MLPANGVAGYARTGLGPQVSLRPGFAWTRIYTTQDTLSYREQAEDTDNGKTFTYDIRGFSPDDNATKQSAFEQLLHYGQMLVRFCDNAGLVRLIGDPVQSLLFTYDLATDPDVPGRRGYSFSLTGTTTRPPAYE